MFNENVLLIADQQYFILGEEIKKDKVLKSTNENQN